MFCEKRVLRNFAKFTGKQLCRRKKMSLAEVFSFEFCEISKNTFSYRTPPVAALIFTWCVKRLPWTIFYQCWDQCQLVLMRLNALLWIIYLGRMTVNWLYIWISFELCRLWNYWCIEQSSTTFKSCHNISQYVTIFQITASQILYWTSVKDLRFYWIR